VSARARGGALALALLAAATAARADVTLTGNQHVGDCDDAGGACTGFTPLDPVSRNQMFNYPINFTLTTTTTIDKVRLDNPVDLDGKLQIYLESRGTNLGSSSSHFGTLSGSTFDLIPDLVLVPGDYVILPDGGCSESSGSTFFYNCPGGKVNDFGYSSITLESTQSNTTVMLNQRRHLGDNTDPSGDDDYDFSGNVSTSSNEFYPDAADGTTIDIGFTLSANLRLTELRFHRLRDINNESPTFATNPKVLVDGSSVGELTTEGDPFPLTLANSLLLLSGNHTLRVESGSFSGQRDDFSWDDIVMVFASTTTSGSPGAFNAVDTGGAVLTGAITTKVAGGAFTLDLYALNGFGTGQNTGYAGTATVEVLNAADNSGAIDVYGCRGSWTVAQSVAGTVAFVAGKAVVAGTFLDSGLKEARIRVTDSTTGAQGCSIDNFAIRPASFGVAPSQGSETTAGTTTPLTNALPGGLPRHRAGQPFTIVASALTAGGAAATAYDGTPEASGTALLPATTNGTLTAGTWGSAVNGVLRTDTAKYSEVGPVTLTIKDTTWAAVDVDDTVASQREFSGTAATGRFVPDHFKVTEGSLAPACAAGGFSYLGSTLAWATPAVTLTAESADDTTTLNYEGTLESLPATLAQPAYAALAGTLDTGGLSAPAIGAAVAGTATVTLPSLSFTRGLIGAFDAEIRIELPAFADDDGIVPEESPIVLGALSAGGGVAFTANAKSQRFGRLYFEPRHGSDRLPLEVPLRAEYFDGVTFQHNAADACTVLSGADVTLAGVGGQTHSVTSAGNGLWTVTLTAPNTPGQATLGIDLASPPVTPAVAYPLLQADADGDGTYAEDPAGIATFGLYDPADQRWIYQREVVGN
jgi:hypothetical protein